MAIFLVYKFKCNICDDIYSGKTIHYFKFRPCKYLEDTPLTNQKGEKSQQKFYYQSYFTHGHKPNFVFF